MSLVLVIGISSDSGLLPDSYDGILLGLGGEASLLSRGANTRNMAESPHSPRSCLSFMIWRRNMSEEFDRKWWFGFRQTHPRPPSRAMALGPYSSFEEAARESEKEARDWHCQVSIPFTAKTKDEAREKAEHFTQ